MRAPVPTVPGWALVSHSFTLTRARPWANSGLLVRITTNAEPPRRSRALDARVDTAFETRQCGRSREGGGTMRFFTDNLDWAGPRHFFTETGKGRVCGGDSGGPYLSMGRKYVIGIHASSEKWPDDECAMGSFLFFDSKQRANRMIDSHIPFINDFVDRVMGGAPHTRCEHERDNLYWCAPPRPVRVVPCMQTCTSNCGNFITSAGMDFGYDGCVADCPARCGE